MYSDSFHNRSDTAHTVYHFAPCHTDIHPTGSYSGLVVVCVCRMIVKLSYSIRVRMKLLPSWDGLEIEGVERCTRTAII